jgi:hypothetical protein
MKTRDGFVSNSSSSSFIVVFSRKPRSLKEVKKKLFNGMDGILNWYDDYEMSYDDIATRVYNDLIATRKLTKNQLHEQLNSIVHSYVRDIECFVTSTTYNSNIPECQFDIKSDIIWDLCREQFDIGQNIREKENEFRATHHLTFFYSDDDETKARPDYDMISTDRSNLQHELNIGRWDIAEKINQEIDKMTWQAVDIFMNDHQGWWYTELSYSDGDPGGVLLEHGDIFRHIESLRISNH